MVYVIVLLYAFYDRQRYHTYRLISQPNSVTLCTLLKVYLVKFRSISVPL